MAVAGLLCAAAIGYAAYAVSRGSVAVPVTRLQPKPSGLSPAGAEQTRTAPRQATTTVESHHGSGGGDDSGHGGDD